MDDKTMQWISVDDEMPDNDTKVLALYWDGEYDVVYGSTIRVDRDNYKFWQPLPPPPSTQPPTPPVPPRTFCSEEE